MTASFPNSVKSFPTLIDLADNVLATHQNERGEEITAVETYLIEMLYGWIPSYATWSYVSADGRTFVVSINSDVTGVLNVKDRIRLSQTTTKYFIVSKVGSYSGGETLVTLYGGTDYTLTSASITSPFYSHSSSPIGFNGSPSKWDYVVTNTTTYTKTSPAANTRYGQTNTMDSSATLPSIDVPIGLWDLYYFAQVRVEVPTASLFAQCRASLSTSQSAEDAGSLFTKINSVNADGTSAGNIVNNVPISALETVELTSKTTYYLLVSTGSGSATSIQVQGSVATTVLKARCRLL